MSNEAGKVRRSHIVGAFGPGAIADFRPQESRTPVSGVMAGLEAWDERAIKKGTLHEQSIREPRLEQRLKVAGFRLPPVCEEDSHSSLDKVLAVRFPSWLQCPSCDRIRRHDEWSRDAGKVGRWCPSCSKDGQLVWVVPVRFVMACEKGHLDEFPWQRWISCSCDRPELKMSMTGPGLAGKRVTCIRCKASRNLEGVFDKDILPVRCHGRRPWLGQDEAGCDKKPRALQRGGSNVYWGATLSALDIPPFSVDLGETFSHFTAAFMNAEPEKWPELIKVLSLEKLTGQPESVLLKNLRDWKAGISARDDEPLEWAEYQQLQEAARGMVSKGEFEAVAEPVPPEFTGYFTSVVRAQRLREVRALVGFTRIHPPSGPFRSYEQKLAPLSLTRLTWLPAVELRGEGIFLDFLGSELRDWESNPDVIARAKLLESQVKQDLREGEEMPDCSPRFLLLHAFAHALIRQLSLECGYSSSALRERIYAGQAPYDMAGVLIHTGSPDSEGTLGGLVRQGRQELLVGTLHSAIRAMAWCSSDPLCITSTMALSSPRNAAACHACVLVAETSCQQFNCLLDRAMLVGTTTHPGIGFFEPLLRAP